MPYSVYVLTNPLGRRYIGLSEDVSHRLAQHNAGLSRWTAPHRPWTLSWMSRPLPLGEARKMENALKRQKGGNGLATLLRSCGS